MTPPTVHDDSPTLTIRLVPADTLPLWRRLTAVQWCWIAFVATIGGLAVAIALLFAGFDMPSRVVDIAILAPPMTGLLAVAVGNRAADSDRAKATERLFIARLTASEDRRQGELDALRRDLIKLVDGLRADVLAHMRTLPDRMDKYATDRATDAVADAIADSYIVQRTGTDDGPVRATASVRQLRPVDD